MAIVTGAASGVGAATARMLTERGVQVVGVDLGWERVPPGGLLHPVAGDVRSNGTWAEAVALARNCGSLSMLVLNAARLAIGTVLELDEDDLSSVLDTNVLGAFRGLRACLPTMLEGGGGSIVAVASTDAVYAEQRLAAYCASKGALLQLIRSVAVDFGPNGIRANAICPGAIDTPFFRRHVDAAPDPSAFLRQKIARHPSGRLLQADDVANAVCFLLDEKSIGFNGAALMIDGGLTAAFDFVAMSPES